jgi:myosin heavy subunit
MQEAEYWDDSKVVQQVRYLGIEEFIRIKKNLYPIRIKYKNFV